jgi:hypothetical protein
MSSDANLFRLFSFVSTGIWVLTAITGIVVVLVFWKRLGSGAFLAAAGCGLLLLTVIFSRIAHALVGATRDSVGLFIGINLATTFGDVIAFGLLLAGAVAGRPKA